MMNFRERNSNFLPVRDPAVRQLLYVIATGNSVAPATWFQSLVPEFYDMLADFRQMTNCIAWHCKQSSYQ